MAPFSSFVTVLVNSLKKNETQKNETLLEPTPSGVVSTHVNGRRGLEESRAGTRLALSTLSTLSPALSTVSHDMSQAPRAAPPWQQHHHNPRASVDQSASTSPAGGVHGGGGALSISWLRDSMLRPEASALPPDTHTARMLRPDAQSGQGRTAGDIARRESRREHVRGAARPWVDPSLP